jgi:hypothetical protein
MVLLDVDSGWTHHPAFPYSKNALRPNERVQVWRGHANRRDQRRPVTATLRSWPSCSEGEVQLPAGPPRRLRTSGSGNGRGETPAWRSRVSAPLFADRRAALNRARGIPDPNAKAASPVTDREMDAGGPYLQFFLQRPMAQQEFERLTMPATRRAMELEQQYVAREALKEEAERINDACNFMTRIGLSPRRPASPPRQFVQRTHHDLADTYSEDGSGRRRPQSALERNMMAMKQQRAPGTPFTVA